MNINQLKASIRSEKEFNAKATAPTVSLTSQATVSLRRISQPVETFTQDEIALQLWVPTHSLFNTPSPQESMPVCKAAYGLRESTAVQVSLDEVQAYVAEIEQERAAQTKLEMMATELQIATERFEAKHGEWTAEQSDEMHAACQIEAFLTGGSWPQLSPMNPQDVQVTTPVQSFVKRATSCYKGLFC